MEESDAYGIALSMLLVLVTRLFWLTATTPVLTPFVKMKYLNKWWTDTVPGTGDTFADQARKAFVQKVSRDHLNNSMINTKVIRPANFRADCTGKRARRLGWSF